VTKPKAIYLECDCHTAYHFLTFEPDEDEPECIYVSFVSTRNESIWHRIKWALWHVFKREDLTFADIMIRYPALRGAVMALEGEK
jgi:hypothetical protein